MYAKSSNMIRISTFISVTIFSSQYPNALLFFFNDTATTEIYTLSLHDALPISRRGEILYRVGELLKERKEEIARTRSEEHTSELQSRRDLVCRLLLEKKKIDYDSSTNIRLQQYLASNPSTY